MGALTLVVTGAAGFIGAAAAAEARRRGHRVRGIVRPGPAAAAAAAAATGAGDALSLDLADPRSAPALAEALAGADAVIHAAGALTGDAARLHRDSVAATEAVLAAAAPGTRIVLVSSLSVLAGRAVPPGGRVDESAPVETDLAGRDAYAAAKLAQEAAARRLAAARGLPLWVLRPGEVVGPGRAGSANLGVALGPLFFCPPGAVPAVAVGDLARALLAAAERPPQGDGTVHVVADDCPSRRDWAAALAGPRKPVLPVPFALLDGVAALLSPVGPRLPGLLRRAGLNARLSPRRYDNRRLHDWLGWQQSVPILAAIAAAARTGAP